MAKPASRSLPRKKDAGTIEGALLKIFRQANKKVAFRSVFAAELRERMLDALIHAATSKCLEFNVAVNQPAKNSQPSFILVSNLRGICEGLIYLTYLSRIDARRAQELITRVLALNTARGIEAQRNFFTANNPTQPVLGAGSSAERVKKSVTKAREQLRAFWKKMGSATRDGPTLLDLSAEVGLRSTYEYIYFVASNFVHFNPQALLRTGWGPECGPFHFSINNMDGYYRSLSSFYGAILFIGFNASFGARYFQVTVDTEIARLIEIIGHVQRWPEVVTFEEMNQKPPMYFLTHAMGKVMRDEDKTFPYGAILQEVQALRSA
jgi:hypothetical protein